MYGNRFASSSKVVSEAVLSEVRVGVLVSFSDVEASMSEMLSAAMSTWPSTVISVVDILSSVRVRWKLMVESRSQFGDGESQVANAECRYIYTQIPDWFTSRKEACVDK